MATINVTHRHSLGYEQAMLRARAIAQAEQHRVEASSWTDGTLSFKGDRFSGTARVASDLIVLEIDLSLLLWPKKSRIAAQLKQVVAENFPEQEVLGNKYRAEICAGQFEAAFETGEKLLDPSPSAEMYETLLCPIDVYTTNLRPGQLHDLLRQIERDPGQTHPAWRRHLRFVLLARLGWAEEGLVGLEEAGPLPERYAWMRHERGRALMEVRFAYAAARDDFAASLAAAPRFWKSAACMAECALCQGDEAEAFALFDACLERLPAHGLPADLRLAAIWRAEMRLWTGQYDDAARDLEAHAAEGVPLALGWRGAARLLLGDAAAARADLDKALALTPSDPEALVWRGEALTRLGRWNEARADFDRATELAGGAIWPLVDRALVRLRGNDVEGFWSDYDRLPPRVVDLFAWKLGVEVERDPDRARAILEAMLVAARGVRRSEVYLFPVWVHRRDTASTKIPQTILVDRRV